MSARFAIGFYVGAAIWRTAYWGFLVGRAEIVARPAECVIMGALWPLVSVAGWAHSVGEYFANRRRRREAQR